MGLKSEANYNNTEKLQNWIILTAKYYIHREKLFGQKGLSLIAFLGEARKKAIHRTLSVPTRGENREIPKIQPTLSGSRRPDRQGIGNQETIPSGHFNKCFLLKN